MSRTSIYAADGDFRPTPKMVDLVKAMLDSRVGSSVVDLCEAADISRDTYYRWFNDERFIAWFRKIWAKEMSNIMVRLDRIGLKRAEEDYRYWEAMQKKYGNLSDKKEVKHAMSEDLKELRDYVMGKTKQVSDNERDEWIDGEVVEDEPKEIEDKKKKE